MTGRMPEEGINPIEFPTLVADVWEWFQSLSGTRQSGMAANPISEQEIHFFFKNRKIDYEIWQIEAIRLLDGVVTRLKE